MKTVKYKDKEYTVYDTIVEAQKAGIPMSMTKDYRNIHHDHGNITSILKAANAGLKPGVWLKFWFGCCQILDIKIHRSNKIIFETCFGWVKFDKAIASIIKAESDDEEKKRVRRFIDWNFVASFIIHGDLRLAYENSYGVKAANMDSKKKSFSNFWRLSEILNFQVTLGA